MGYGMFYDNGLEFGNPELNVGLSQGFLTNLSITRSTFANPTGTTTTASTTTPFTIQARMPVNYQSPYTQQWSLDVQRNFGTTWFLDVGYFGNIGIHLPGYTDFNQPSPFAYRNCTPTAKCYAGPVTVAANGVDFGTSPIVNSSCRNQQAQCPAALCRLRSGRDVCGHLHLQLQLPAGAIEQALQRQLAVRPRVHVVARLDHRSRRPYHRRRAVPQAFGAFPNNYGPTIADRRHVLTANFVWELPWMRNQQGVVGHVLGGWQFSGVQTFQTGLPLTAFIGNAGCVSGTGANCVDAIGSACFGATPVGCRVNQVGDPNSGGQRSILGTWFNAAAFSVPTSTQTDLPSEHPGAIRAPGFWNTDLALFKNIKFTEVFTGQFRLETFNTFNHTNPICCASTSFAASLFNTIDSTRDPRIVQIAMKFNF